MGSMRVFAGLCLWTPHNITSPSKWRNDSAFFNLQHRTKAQNSLSTAVNCISVTKHTQGHNSQNDKLGDIKPCRIYGVTEIIYNRFENEKQSKLVQATGRRVNDLGCYNHCQSDFIHASHASKCWRLTTVFSFPRIRFHWLCLRFLTMWRCSCAFLNYYYWCNFIFFKATPVNL